MSPRAAWRLESLGFEGVYDYVAGKVDWLGMGLPTEGTIIGEPRAGTHARPDVPTCRLDDDVLAVCDAVAASGWETCMVVNDEGVLLGRIGRHGLGAREGTVEQAMSEGPSTVRPNARLADLLETMRTHDLRSFPVTRLDGTLVGLVLRDEAERALAEELVGQPPS